MGRTEFLRNLVLISKNGMPLFPFQNPRLLLSTMDPTTNEPNPQDLSTTTEPIPSVILTLITDNAQEEENHQQQPRDESPHQMRLADQEEKEAGDQDQPTSSTSTSFDLTRSTSSAYSLFYFSLWSWEGG